MKSEYIKEMQELAALKAENERLKEDLQKMHDGYDDVVDKFEADKAELLEALSKVLFTWSTSESFSEAKSKAKAILSKHEAK